MIPFFIGASARSSNVLFLLEQICYHLQQLSGEIEEIPKTYDELETALLEFLEKASRKTQIVIVIDALDQLQDLYQAQDLYWLPQNVPLGVKIVVSSLEGKCTRALKKRMAQEVSLDKLSQKESHTIIQKYLEQYGKTLEPDCYKELLSKKESSNPLYLKVALEECRTLGGNEMHLRIVDIIRNLPEDTMGLFEQMLERLEREWEQERLQKLMCYLVLSRGGLQIRELRTLLGMITRKQMLTINLHCK